MAPPAGPVEEFVVSVAAILLNLSSHYIQIFLLPKYLFYMTKSRVEQHVFLQHMTI